MRTLKVMTHSIPKLKLKGQEFKCGQCGEKFTKYDLIKVQKNLHVPPGGTVEYKCTVEGYDCVVSTKGGLRQYVRGHEGGTKKCNVCGKEFLFNNSLAKHMKSHNMQRLQWHHCSHNGCDLKFKSKSDLSITQILMQHLIVG